MRRQQIFCSPCLSSNCAFKQQAYYWIHDKCRQTIHFDRTNLQLLCNKCDIRQSIVKWKFLCKRHNYNYSSLQNIIPCLKNWFNKQNTKSAIDKLSKQFQKIKNIKKTDQTYLLIKPHQYRNNYQPSNLQIKQIKCCQMKSQIKGLQDYMIPQFQRKIKYDAKSSGLNILSVMIKRLYDFIFQILIQIFIGIDTQNDIKRKTSKSSLEKYLEQFVPQTGRQISKMQSNAHIISTVFDTSIYSQIGGTCYAHAVAQASYSTESRIIGRDPENHQTISQNLIDKFGYDGAITQEATKFQCERKNFKWQWVNRKGAYQAVLNKRVIIAIFSLSKKGWKQFSQNQINGSIMRELEQGDQGHAVAIIGVDMKDKVWIIKNAWGHGQVGKNYYKNSIVKMKMELPVFYYIDMYFIQDDLTPQDKLNYHNYIKKEDKKKKQTFKPTIFDMKLLSLFLLGASFHNR